MLSIEARSADDVSQIPIRLILTWQISLLQYAYYNNEHELDYGYILYYNNFASYQFPQKRSD